MDYSNSNFYMEWKTLESESESKPAHSTPLSYRPAPVASPNLSYILTEIELEVLKLIDRLAKLSLN